MKKREKLAGGGKKLILLFQWRGASQTGSESPTGKRGGEFGRWMGRMKVPIAFRLDRWTDLVSQRIYEVGAKDSDRRNEEKYSIRPRTSTAHCGWARRREVN